MPIVAVTGGTGTLGSRVVSRLVAGGHEVRVLSRTAGAAPPGATRWVGDVRTGDGLRDAFEGTTVVVHAASNPFRHVRETEVAGTANVLAAASASGSHVVYISIVGVDRHRYPYYRAKRAAEEVLESSAASWAILRATQFHELLARFLAAGVFFRTENLAFQPVDAGEVADRLVSLALSGATGHAPDLGGPEVLPIRRLVEVKRRTSGKGTRLLPVPAVSWLGDFDRRLHCTPEHADGTRTWEQWWGSRPGS
jgi:uncharacterized protein YbjT (DUF2867 family)